MCLGGVSSSWRPDQAEEVLERVCRAEASERLVDVGRQVLVGVESAISRELWPRRVSQILFFRGRTGDAKVLRHINMLLYNVSFSLKVV